MRNRDSEELFYQLGLRQFGNFHRLKLEPPPSIKTLIRLAVRTESGRWKESGINMEEEAVVEVSFHGESSSDRIIEHLWIWNLLRSFPD
jgi:hypothetical protein